LTYNLPVLFQIKTEQFDVWIAFLCHHIQELRSFEDSPFLSQPYMYSESEYVQWCCIEGGVLEIPFNITVQTRGLMEVDDEKIATESLLSSHTVNHSRTLRCTDEVHCQSRA